MVSRALPPESPVQLDYRPTLSDYVKTAVVSATRSVAAVALGSYLVGIAILPLVGGDVGSWVTLFIGLTLITGLYVVPFIWWTIRRRPDLMLGPHRLTVDAWGVRSETATVRMEQAWPTFRRVREVAGGFLLDYGTGANALIPGHAFDATTVVRFRQLAAGAGKLDRSPGWRGTVVGITLGGTATVAFILIVTATAPA
jgi:hypothetical protein